MERGLVFLRRRLGPRGAFPVGFVHRDDVGELEHAFLQALQLVAGAAEQKHDEDIGEIGDRGLRLADAHRLDDDHVEPRRLA